MREVTITKKQFMELGADVCSNLARKNDDNFSMVMSGAIVTCELSDELFGSEESKTFTEEEFARLGANGIYNLTHDEKFKVISTALGLMAIMVIGEIKCKLFKNEEEN